MFPSPGQPKTAATKANVAAVANVIKQVARPKLTVKELADTVDITSGTVHNILTWELILIKLYASFDGITKSYPYKNYQISF